MFGNMTSSPPAPITTQTKDVPPTLLAITSSAGQSSTPTLYYLFAKDKAHSLIAKTHFATKFEQIGEAFQAKLRWHNGKVLV